MAEQFRLVNYYTGWWFGTSFLFFHILGMSSSQLTNPYFSEGFSQPPTSMIHLYIYRSQHPWNPKVWPFPASPCEVGEHLRGTVLEALETEVLTTCVVVVYSTEDYRRWWQKGRMRRDFSGCFLAVFCWTKQCHHSILRIYKESWEAIFRVTDDFYLMKGGVRFYIVFWCTSFFWDQKAHSCGIPSGKLT